MGLLFESLCADTTVGVAILSSLIYLRYSYIYSYWKRRGIPYVPLPTSLWSYFGDIFFMRKSPALVMSDLYHKLNGEPYGGIFLTSAPSLLVRDPEIIKHVLVKDFAHFHDRIKNINEKVNPLEENLFFLKGEKWRWLRAKLTPTFTSGKVKVMFQILIDGASEMKKCIEPIVGKQEPLEIRELIAKYTTDIIGAFAFGLQFNSLKDPDSEMRAMSRKLLTPSAKNKFTGIIIKTFPCLANLLCLTFLDLKISRFFRRVIEETVKYRENQNVVRNDFLQVLIQLKIKGQAGDGPLSGNEEVDEGNRSSQEFGKENMTDGLLAAQCLMILIAGVEESSTTVSFCMYELALNPDIQDRVLQEVGIVLEEHNGSITYEAIQKMSYLDRVLDETMRKYPPVPSLERQCTKSFTFPGTNHVVEKGSNIFIPVYAIHRDPNHYPDPERFDPDRFTEEGKKSRHRFSYLPFGEGPRNCIGKRLGLMQTKVSLVALLSKFRFAPCEKTEIPIVFHSKSPFLRPTEGIWLQVTNR
uniref:Cytochrome P450 n=1 Tax=Timema douglasi TaxID=61478 RepID=A0A7R8Z4X4_TIMDO|nr:unnamed protein product [Timema douglasi]